MILGEPIENTYDYKKIKLLLCLPSSFLHCPKLTNSSCPMKQCSLVKRQGLRYVSPSDPHTSYAALGQVKLHLCVKVLVTTWGKRLYMPPPEASLMLCDSHICTL